MSDYNNSLDKTRSYCIEQFDKNIVFIASGSLGISFAFIKDIVNLSKATHINLLIYSWYIFSGVIFLSLLGHYISMQGHNWALANANLNDDDYNEGIKRRNLPIKILNIAMIIAIFIGALLLINFVNQNINKP